jgi:hypothetical protein
VKGNWKAVKVEVEYKEKKSKKQFSIPSNRSQGPRLRPRHQDRRVHAPLYDGGRLDHSSSNNPENPAAQLEVFQNQKEIFHGWLFAKFPAVHPFQHDKYGVTLVEGIKK